MSQDTASDTARVPEDSLGDEAQAAARALREVASETLALLGLEAQLAGSSLAGMLLAAVAAAALLLSAWLLALAGVAIALSYLGANLALVLLAFALGNAALGLYLTKTIRRLSGNLRFRAIRETWFGSSP
jgi:hypothetical protein